MPREHNTSSSINRDLDRLSTNMTVAYVIASVVLCAAILFSYYSMKRILIEQSSLTAFGNATTELRMVIEESSILLSDLKTAKEQPVSESRLEAKVKKRMDAAIVEIAILKETTKQRLLTLADYRYYEDFDRMFNQPPDNIWQKIDDYLARLREITSNSKYGTPGSALLWLPVEATAARSGSLGNSYKSAIDRLQFIVSQRSEHLTSTHRKLMLVSISIVFLEFLLIFYPLKRHLNRVNSNLQSAHKQLFDQANFDTATGFRTTSGAVRYLEQDENSNQFDYLIIISHENSESIGRIIGPMAMDDFFVKFTQRFEPMFTSKILIFRAGDNDFGVLKKQEADDTDEAVIAKIQKTLTKKLSLNNSIVYPEVRLGSTALGSAADNIVAAELPSHLIDARLSAQSYQASETIIPLYESGMRDRIEEQNQMIEKIRMGLANNEFVPFYQIKVDAKSGLACGMEALCRWISADGTMRSPAEFIPVAEKSGLITQMTWQLLGHISTDYRQWRQHGVEPGRIAFNAAENLLRESDFAKKMRELVAQTGSDQCPLDLEITENVAVDSQSDSIAMALSSARDMGMHIALDDFGTGYASLSSIVSMEIDVIKVDQSFVRMMLTNDDAKNIVTSIIQLCRQLNRRCVVEGVETENEWIVCRDLGCDEIQGYYFHKPAPAADILQVLQLEQQQRKAV